MGLSYRGRYKAILIDADTYLLNVSCYIHRNPLYRPESSSARRITRGPAMVPISVWTEFRHGYPWRKHFGLGHYCSVSGSNSRFERRMAEDEKLGRLVDRVGKSICKL